ncbi:hypothetical protein IF1G_02852 [Cordyceps javanica]|uniref:Uncharacterized protein n=1 Tax=Cordyceps javanica TaxID=43265 RepID=A0A545VAL9_9HYPO|nr:hypothetical protein IF1G_02852 [Cordyceps javanica]
MGSRSEKRGGHGPPHLRRPGNKITVGRQGCSHKGGWVKALRDWGLGWRMRKENNIPSCVRERDSVLSGRARTGILVNCYERLSSAKNQIV